MSNNQRDNEQINEEQTTLKCNRPRLGKYRCWRLCLGWASTGAGGYALPIQCDVGVRYLYSVVLVYIA